MNKTEEYKSYQEIKPRIDEIAEKVNDPAIPLDEALDLYEEAAQLVLRVSSLLETDITAEETQGLDIDSEAEKLAGEKSNLASVESIPEPASQTDEVAQSDDAHLEAASDTAE
ncbi:MAG: exodeoxyribonuclease VII small subunit [Eggerthellaceae bacterium]|jgi:exodeoxyribonuclease VII small subunit